MDEVSSPERAPLRFAIPRTSRVTALSTAFADDADDTPGVEFRSVLDSDDAVTQNAFLRHQVMRGPSLEDATAKSSRLQNEGIHGGSRDEDTWHEQVSSSHGQQLAQMTDVCGCAGCVLADAERYWHAIGRWNQALECTPTRSLHPTLLFPFRIFALLISTLHRNLL